MSSSFLIWVVVLAMSVSSAKIPQKNLPISGANKALPPIRALFLKFGILPRFREPNQPYYPRINTSNGPTPQIPPVWEALRVLKGEKSMNDPYPDYESVPSDLAFDCQDVSQSGYYADVATGCQVFHRCDVEGGRTSQLCPKRLIFNQITLVCDWWYNIDCPRSEKFRDYSNARLSEPSWPLLSGDDSEDDNHEIAPTTKRPTRSTKHQGDGDQDGDSSTKAPITTTRKTTTEEPETEETTIATTLRSTKTSKRPISTTQSETGENEEEADNVTQPTSTREPFFETSSKHPVMPISECNLSCGKGDRCVIRYNKPWCIRTNKPGSCPKDVDSSSNSCMDDADCQFSLKCCQAEKGKKTCSEQE